MSIRQKISIGISLSLLLSATPAYADRTVYAPTKLAPVATAGTVLFDDGTAAAPSMSFSSDPDTGIYRPQANELGFVRNGSEALRITSTAIAAQVGYVVYTRPGTNSSPGFSFGTDTNTGLFAPASDTLGLSTGGTERMRIKSTGQLRFVPLAADPSGAEAGDVYYNSGTNKLKVYDGSSWVDLN